MILISYFTIEQIFEKKKLYFNQSINHFNTVKSILVTVFEVRKTYMLELYVYILISFRKVNSRRNFTYFSIFV